MAGKEVPVKNSSALGSGSTPEEEVAARTFCGRRKLEEKAEDSHRAVAAPAVVDVADEKPDAAAGNGNSDDDVKWVEMPLEDIAWLLAQKREDYRVRTLEDYTLHRRSSGSTNGSDSDCRSAAYTREDLAKHREMVLQGKATDEAWKEDFFAFQEWVRDTFDRNGCVMVPEGFEKRNQDLIDEEWEKVRHELEMIDAYPPPSSNKVPSN